MCLAMLLRVALIKLETHCVVYLSCAGRPSDPAQIILLTLAINYVSEVRYFCNRTHTCGLGHVAHLFCAATIDVVVCIKNLHGLRYCAFLCHRPCLG